MDDITRVAKTIQQTLKWKGYDIPFDAVKISLMAGLENGPTRNYKGHSYKESYVLYIP